MSVEKSPDVSCRIDLGKAPAFTTHYMGNAPVPVLAAYGVKPLHRFLLEREVWDYERILADKGKKILRSDRGKSSRGIEWRDIVIDEGEGIFIHIDSGRLSSYAPDPQIAEVSAHAFETSYARPRNTSNGCYHLITTSGDSIGAEPVELSEGNPIESGDLDLFYGSGFAEWTGAFVESLSAKKAGLSVLEGSPGTGKTSFIRHLMWRLKNNHRFYFIPPENAAVLSNPELIGFWRQQHASHPSQRFVCVLEDAEFSLMSRAEDNRRLVGAILNMTDGLLADFLRLHLVCTINCKSSDIDAALTRPGRLVAHRIFSRLDPLAAQLVAHKVNKPLRAQADYSLAEIFNSDPIQQRESPGFGFAG